MVESECLHAEQDVFVEDPTPAMANLGHLLKTTQ